MKYVIDRENFRWQLWQLLKTSLIIVSLSTQLAACSHQKNAAKRDKGKPPVPVKIATVTQKTVPLEIKAIGNVEAYAVVSVRAQIGGQLMQVYFKQGDYVKKGDRLFQIDSRPLEAALEQAKANLVKDQALIQQAEAKKAADEAQVKQAQAKWEADKAQIAQAVAKNKADQSTIQVAIANSQKNIAQQKQAQSQVKRYENLYQEGAISKDQYEQYITQAEASLANSDAGTSLITNAQANANASNAEIINAQSVANASKSALENTKALVLADQANIDSAKATLQADLAVLQNAQLQLNYTKIVAPIDGKTGSLLVTEGNLIRTNDNNPLVVINQVQPIYVTFAIPQQKLALVRQYMDHEQLKVKAIIAKDEQHPEIGKLTFIDNAIDPTTGTVKLKAIFANSNHKLWTGQFVNVVLELTAQKNAIAVPSPAIQTGQQGQFVFIIQSDKTVKMQPVEVSRTVNNDAVITTGLQPGDQVVIDGVSRLIPGSQIITIDR